MDHEKALLMDEMLDALKVPLMDHEKVLLKDSLMDLQMGHKKE